MKLTEAQKYDAIALAVEAHYKPKAKVFLEKRVALIEECKAIYYGSDLDLMESLPEGWLIESPNFSFDWSGMVFDIPLGFADGISWEFLKKNRTLFKADQIKGRRFAAEMVIDSRDSDNQSFGQLASTVAEKRALQEAMSRLAYDALDALRPYQSLKDIRVGWPEIAPFFIDCPEGRSSDEKLTKSVVAPNLNSRLGLKELEPLAA